MNRKDRRALEKQLRHSGLSKTAAKEYVAQNYGPNAPKPTATVKLEDGTEQVIGLEGITDVNDPQIMERVNEALNDNSTEICEG